MKYLWQRRIRRETHTHIHTRKIPPVGLGIAYENVTHQVSLKRGRRKQLSPHLDGHTSQAGKPLTAVTLVHLVGHLCLSFQKSHTLSLHVFIFIIVVGTVYILNHSVLYVLQEIRGRK